MLQKALEISYGSLVILRPTAWRDLYQRSSTYFYIARCKSMGNMYQRSLVEWFLHGSTVIRGIELSTRYGQYNFHRIRHRVCGDLVSTSVSSMSTCPTSCEYSKTQSLWNRVFEYTHFTGHIHNQVICGNMAIQVHLNFELLMLYCREIEYRYYR